jgi:putative hydrolase of the HAD superfamily
VLALVDAKRTQSFRDGLLSNNPHEMAAKMRAEGIDKHFDVFHVSAETGYVKPEVEAFENFAKELGVAPQELVFIDDSAKSLSSAQQVGFIPIQYTGYDALVTRLAELGIKV